MALMVLSGMAYAVADSGQKQRSIITSKIRLRDIEKYISQSRENTEDYFARRLKELKLQAEDQIQLFENSEMNINSCIHFFNWIAHLIVFN